MLEHHHSAPFYTKARRVMSWHSKGRQWTGSVWGTKKKGGGKGKKNQEGSDSKKNQKGDKTDKGPLFPSYDAMELGGFGGLPSSSSATASQDVVWQQALKSLIMSNPGLTVPKEITEALEGSMTEDSKKELYTQQRALNARRKAQQRLERLQNALTRKKLQMQAYQEQMRQQLKNEMEKFQAEQKDIEKSIEEAKNHLAQIEKGDNIPEVEEIFTDTTDSSLAGMLGITADANHAEIQRLQGEKDHAVSVASQLHQQIQMIMAQSGTAMAPGLSDVLMTGVSPKRSSPQMPAVGPFKRHKMDGQQSKPPHEVGVPDPSGLDGLG